MSALNELATIITADVLVVGHGLAGLAAAITAKEDYPNLNVVTVDKCFPGYGGKANKGGGHVAFIPEGAEETYVQYHTENLGDYLNDQDMLRIYANATMKTMDRWEKWGVQFKLSREEALNAHAIIPWKVTLVDLDIMMPMARHAKKIGVKCHAKIAITDLLTEGDRVVGAYGISLLTGESYVFKAKAVILASGDQNWGIMNMWNGKGEGIAAAYRVGAKMRNAEFGTFVNITDKKSKTVAYGAEDYMVNAKGKPCTMESRLDLPESMRSVVGGVDLGGQQSVLMYLEVRDGNGPIFEDVAKNEFTGSWIARNLCCYGGDADPEYLRPLAQKLHGTLFFKNRAGAYEDKDVKLREVVPGVVGECSPLYVDHGMATSVPGLFAAGDICANGSAWAGAVPTPPGRNRGSGLMHAVMTAIISAGTAGAYARGHELGEVSDAQVDAYRATLTAPLANGGDLSPRDYMWEIKSLMQPVEYTGYKREDRLQRALARVLELKADFTRVHAKDAHQLITANEARSTVLCAEMYFRASLERKESRGWHLREDFELRDDKNHLNWIVLQDRKGQMALTTENLPIATYQYQPQA